MQNLSCLRCPESARRGRCSAPPRCARTSADKPRTRLDPERSPPSLSCLPFALASCLSQMSHGWTCVNVPQGQHNPPQETSPQQSPTRGYVGPTQHTRIPTGTPANTTPSCTQLPLLAPLLEQGVLDSPWRVYGFPEPGWLLFSLESELYIHDEKQLELHQRSWRKGSGTRGMEETYRQVR